MAFIRVEPVPVDVRTDWFSGRPREITWDGLRTKLLKGAADQIIRHISRPEQA